AGPNVRAKCREHRSASGGRGGWRNRAAGAAYGARLGPVPGPRPPDTFCLRDAAIELVEIAGDELVVAPPCGQPDDRPREARRPWGWQVPVHISGLEQWLEALGGHLQALPRCLQRGLALRGQG